MCHKDWRLCPEVQLLMRIFSRAWCALLHCPGEFAAIALPSMGLETVEILMEIEDEFDISIPDHIAYNAVTVGDTHRIIVDMLVAKGAVRSAELEADAWQRLVKIVTAQVGMKPQAVRPESRWIPDITKHG
jgi:hypothetical protein